MEKKNTVLLTIVAIATLLVAIVGATFAYFTATTATGGNTGTGVANVSTASVSGARLELNPVDTKTYLMYPGGFAYTVISVDSVKVDPTGDPNEYAVSYKIDLEFSNATKTILNWNLYRSNTLVENAKTCDLKTESVKVTETQAETKYYYICTGDNGAFGGEKLASGSGYINPGASQQQVTVSDVQTLKTNEPTYYYYLVVDYPNDATDNQNKDMGNQISAAITGVSALSAVASE